MTEKKHDSIDFDFIAFLSDSAAGNSIDKQLRSRLLKRLLNC
jgi:hypothetical protein